LRQDARLPNAAIGKKVGLSEPAARRRVGNLLLHGVIKRFTVDIAEGGGVSALVFIHTTPHVPSKKMAKALEAEPGIGSVWELSGNVDAAITIFAPDIGTLNEKIDKIRNMEGVERTELSVILKKWK
ncbi:MAG: Lrp/AsnC family transcriptional regulator, partial [Candidatus Micrarchaeota archaeon]|nr:Lrp/AsnC family transcriptional regulator [Candidatus Micrarchaeota archaeon]